MSLSQTSDFPEAAVAEGVQAQGGRKSLKKGTIALKDPDTGETVGEYDFLSGGHGRGALPWGEYEISNGRRRDDVEGMMIDGYGYSFDVTQKGMPNGEAIDPRFEKQRTLLRIHPDGGKPGTMGCIGILGDRDVQEDFFQNAMEIQEQCGGTFALSFTPEGQIVEFEEPKKFVAAS